MPIARIKSPSEEQERLEALCALEKECRAFGYKMIAGVDEAGRGPLAGPVVAAACYIPEGLWISGVNDSKKLDARSRSIIYHELVENPAICYAVGLATVEEIDELNIYWAARLAMRRAVESMKQAPDFLLVDGMDLKEQPIPSRGVVRGDSISYSIAAASIIAKEERDRLMVELDREHPGYGLSKHKGYATKGHIDAITRLGPAPFHRKTFEPIKSLYQNLMSV